MTKVQGARAGRDAVRTELKTLATPLRAEARDKSQIRAELAEYLENWRAMAREGVADARRLLRAVLVGRFVFTWPHRQSCRRGKVPGGSRASSMS